MPDEQTLPHHRLIAYDLALQLVQLVARTRIGETQLRAQARKSAISAALNTAEGAARESKADKGRFYAIALAECCECCAAIEIAGALGTCAPAHVKRAVALGTRLRAILRKLSR